jgi:hypothetical protein
MSTTLHVDRALLTATAAIGTSTLPAAGPLRLASVPARAAAQAVLSVDSNGDVRRLSGFAAAIARPHFLRRNLSRSVITPRLSWTRSA